MELTQAGNSPRTQSWTSFSIDFHLDCTVVREHTGWSQLKFAEICLMAQNIVNRCTQPMNAWKEHGFSICWTRYKCQLYLLLVLRPSAAVLMSSPATLERRGWELQLLQLHPISHGEERLRAPTTVTMVHFSISLHLFWLQVVFGSTVW